MVSGVFFFYLFIIKIAKIRDFFRFQNGYLLLRKAMQEVDKILLTFKDVCLGGGLYYLNI